MKKVILILAVSAQLAISCPVKIHNDSPHPIMIVNPYGTQAIYLEPDQTGVIDPSLSSLWYYFPLKYLKKETLKIYTQKDNGAYVLTYILKENYCAPGVEQLLFSTIKDLVNHPTDRYYAIKLAHNNTKDSHEH